MYLIAGLGNPGPEYENTRHNVGFAAARKLFESYRFPAERARFQAQFSKGRIGSEDVILVRPMTYMNNSGTAVRALMDYFKISPDHVIVIYDDVDLPFGHLRIRENGSAGGHNGMKSIVQHLGTQDFPRVRIGVGAKPAGWDLADYVLSHFTAEEKGEIEKTVEKAAGACADIVEKGLASAMNQYNTKREKPVKEKPKKEETKAEGSGTGETGSEALQGEAGRTQGGATMQDPQEKA